MKKTAITAILLTLCLVLAACGGGQTATQTDQGGGTVSIGNDSDEYYMISFMVGLEFWQDCYRGFEDAAAIYGAKTVYTGAQEFDINQQVTVLEQVVAKNPAGIAITCVNDEALVGPIQNAMAKGINVVVFDSDSPASGRLSCLQTGNETGGAEGAKHLAEALGGTGEVGVIYTVGTPTHEARAQGFIDEIEANYPGMSVVAQANYDGSQEDAATAAASMIQANPNIKGIFGVNSPCGLGISTAVREAGKKDDVLVMAFDADESLYDAIKDGSVLGTVKQGSYNMGFWSMQFLFCTQNKLLNPVNGWDVNGVNPLPPYVDTGVTVIDASNVEIFAA